MDKAITWITNGKKYIGVNWKILKRATKNEKDETIRAYDILIRFLNKETKGDVTPAELKFLKAQSIDLFKILILLSIKVVPSPIPITPILIWLGKKIGVKIMPSSHLKTYENRKLGKN